MKTIKLSNSLEIPLMDFATQASAALGIKGSGKSQDMGLMAEQLMSEGIPITVLDPAGVWRFLKVPGRGAGFPVVVIGGEDADFPLSEHTIEDITRAAMKEGVSIVVDLFTSRPSKNLIRQIVLKCVNTMFYENKKYGVRTVFLEEAAEVVPQRIQKDMNHVYSAVEQLVRVGGNCSLGVVMINPRAENLNKDVLELCDFVFLHRQRGRRSLKNLDDWFEQAGLEDKQVDAIIADTMTMGAGECYFMSKDSSCPVRLKFPLKRSFHPDRKNPEAEIVAVKKTVDVAEWVTKLKAALPKPEEKKAAPAAKVAAPRAIIKEVEKIIEVPVLSPEQETLLNTVHDQLENVALMIQTLRAKVEFVRAVKTQPKRTFVPLAATPRVQRTPVEANGEIKMSTGVKRMLTALAQHSDMDDVKLGALVGIVASAGHFGNEISKAKRAGWIIGEPSSRSITPEGMSVLGQIEPLPTGEALVVYWKNKLPTRAGDMLQVLFDHGEDLTDEQIGQAIGIISSAGHFGNMMSELTKRDLVTGTPSARKIHPVFYQ